MHILAIRCIGRVREATQNRIQYWTHMTSPQPVETRWALVTGGGKGIGESVCRQLAAQGLRIAVADIDGVNARRVAESLGAPHLAVTADVADESSVRAMFEQVERQ